MISADDPRNKYGHTCLLFVKEGLKNFPIVRHQGCWYELYRTKDTNTPFLGPFRPKVHATDLQVDLTEEPTGNEDDPESETEDELTQQNNLQNASVVIDPEGPESPHQEDREPWAPLVTPIGQYSTFVTVLSQQPLTMASTTAATTTTTTKAGPAATPINAPPPPAPTPATTANPTPGGAPPGVDNRLRTALATASEGLD